MLSKDDRRNKSFLEKESLGPGWKPIVSGTLSPATIITSSSGYSTGSSATSTAIRKVAPHHQEQQTRTKTKGKVLSTGEFISRQDDSSSSGLQHLISKLKNFILPSKSKLTHSNTTHSTFSRDDRSFVSFNHPQLLFETSQTVSLPFTYYQRPPPIEAERFETKNFDQIAAWVNHHHHHHHYASPDLKYMDEMQPGLASRKADDQGTKGTWRRKRLEPIEQVDSDNWRREREKTREEKRENERKNEAVEKRSKSKRKAPAAGACWKRQSARVNWILLLLRFASLLNISSSSGIFRDDRIRYPFAYVRNAMSHKRRRKEEKKREKNVSFAISARSCYLSDRQIHLRIERSGVMIHFYCCYLIVIEKEKNYGQSPLTSVFFFFFFFFIHRLLIWILQTSITLRRRTTHYTHISLDIHL